MVCMKLFYSSGIFVVKFVLMVLGVGRIMVGMLKVFIVYFYIVRSVVLKIIGISICVIGDGLCVS